MEKNYEVMEIALTVAVALAVGLTSASFGMARPSTQSGSEPNQLLVLIDRALQSWAPLRRPGPCPSLPEHLEN